jgi:isopentenyldiphosphate isomerase
MLSQDEIIPIVNFNDEIIWYKARKDVTPDDIYRVSACWIKDSDGNILLAQRAFSKKHNPWKRWPAVAGKVQKWETYEENIIKELYEEVAIHALISDLQLWPKKYRTWDWTYFWQRFLYTYDWDKLLLRVEEWAVEQLKRFTPQDLKDLLESFPDDFLESVKWWLEHF